MLFRSYFRHMDEDPGCKVAVHPCISEFVGRKYEELFLARHVENIVYAGEFKLAHSVLSAKILRNSGRVILRPLIFGEDAADNLKAHVEMLANEGLPNIFFEMDLGISDYNMFAPALLESSFEPRFLVPLAAKSDVVVFQYIPGGIH